MGSAYDADRIFGILTRVRACLGIAVGVLLMAVCGAAGAVHSSAQSPPYSTITMADGSPAPPDAQAFIRRQDEARLGHPSDARTAIQGVLVLTVTILLGISAFEFALGSWIGAGERRGFLWGAVTEGISCLLGLFNMAQNPVAGIGFLLSLATFVYCLARLNGTGPKPV